MAQDEKNYKDTLNLPQTEFPMKGRMKEREKDFQAEWARRDIYAAIREARKGAKKFVLHDGPPYPTGDLHIGTGMNKVLKDFLVQLPHDAGLRRAVRPGLGLPRPADRVQGARGTWAPRPPTTPKAEIRRAAASTPCTSWPKQREQFKSLGVCGDWDNPYLTLNHRYERGVIEGFADMVEGGFVYRRP